jgi:hypothetical protein
VADAILGGDRTDLQPGLFDRRAEREHEAHVALVARAVEDIQRRLAAIDCALTIASRPVEIALALFPSGGTR